MVCPKCGNKMKSGAKFCGKCGAALNGGGQEQAKAPAETPKVSKASVGRNKLLLGGAGLLVLCAAVLFLFVPAGLFASSKPTFIAAAIAALASSDIGTPSNIRSPLLSKLAIIRLTSLATSSLSF